MAKAKKKGVNGRTKGHTFERKLAKIFSDWSEMEVMRTPMSGGWNKTGDITPKAPEDMVKWPINIEAKCYARDTFKFQDLLSKDKQGPIGTWWSQCLRDAVTSRRIPMLVFKQNFDETYAMLRKQDIDTSLSQSYLYDSGLDVIIMKLDVFLDTYSIEYFTQQWRKNENAS